MTFGIQLIKGKMKSFSDALELYAENYSPNYIQMFTHGPRSTNVLKYDVPRFLKIAKKHKIILIVHSAYPSNLWKYINKNGKTESKLQSNSQLLPVVVSELKSCEQFGAYGVVFHIPKISWKKFIEGVVFAVKHNPYKTKLLLEMKASTVWKQNYMSYGDLNALCKQLSENGIKPKDAQFVIDTAHIVVQRKRVQIKTYVQAKNYLKNIKYPKYIGLLHINGTSGCGTEDHPKYRDIHEVPLSSKDLIWRELKYKNSGCRAFIEYANDLKIPWILEVKGQIRHPKSSINNFIKKINGDI